MNDGSPITLNLFDASKLGDKERPRIYPETDAALICFSVSNSESFDKIQGKWIPELKENCPGVRFVLVGTNIDEQRAVTASHGASVSDSVGSENYVECSIPTEKGLQNVFDEAIKAALKGKKKEESSGGCFIM